MTKVFTIIFVIISTVMAAFPAVYGQNYTSIELLLKQGIDMAQHSQYEEAIEFFDLVLLTDPENIEALDNKGVSLYYLGRFEEAITHFDKISEINPNHIESFIKKGKSFKAIGKHQEAIASFDQVLKLDPAYLDGITNVYDFLDKILYISTKDSKYFAYFEIVVRDSSGNLVAYNKADKIDYLPFSMTDEFFQDLANKKNVTVNQKNYELKEVIFQYDVETRLPIFRTSTFFLFGPQDGSKILYFYGYHYGIPVEIGDNVTIKWTIMRLIEV